MCECVTKTVKEKESPAGVFRMCCVSYHTHLKSISRFEINVTRKLNNILLFFFSDCVRGKKTMKLLLSTVNI